MTEKEVNLKSILFLIIGILLLLSLVICIYIVSSESDLVKVQADVIDVKKGELNNGKSDVTVSFDIDQTTYQYNFYYKDDVKIDDKIDVYYHEKNINSVTTFKTSKLIFVCPVAGLILCILSIIELFKQNKHEEQLFQTSVIDVLGNTQALQIITSDEPIEEYRGLPEEHVEAEVKTLKKEHPEIAKPKKKKRPNTTEVKKFTTDVNEEKINEDYISENAEERKDVEKDNEVTNNVDKKNIEKTNDADQKDIEQKDIAKGIEEQNNIAKKTIEDQNNENNYFIEKAPNEENPTNSDELSNNYLSSNEAIANNFSKKEDEETTFKENMSIEEDKFTYDDFITKSENISNQTRAKNINSIDAKDLPIKKNI